MITILPEGGVQNPAYRKRYKTIKRLFLHKREWPFVFGLKKGEVMRHKLNGNITLFDRLTIRKNYNKHLYNYSMKISKILFFTLLIAVFFTGSLAAQGQMAPGQQQMPDVPTSDEVSDEELDRFVSAILAVEPIQIELQGEMEKVIVDEDLELERFQELMMAMQNPQMAEQVGMTEEEQQKIQNLQPKLVELQMEAETEIIAKIEEQGFDVERYNILSMGAQQDQELMARLQEKLEDAEEQG